MNMSFRSDLMERMLFLAPDEGTPTDGTDGAGKTTEAPEDGHGDAGEEGGTKPPEGAPDAGGKPSWMQQLPDSLKNDEALSKYASFAEFTKAAKEAMDKKPADTDGKEGAKAPVAYKDFAKKLDVNTDPMGTQTQFLMDKLQSMGVSQKDAEAFFDDFQGNVTKNTQGFLEKGQEWCDQKMRHDWGDKYQERKNLMDRAMKSLGDKDGSLSKQLKATGSMANPAVWEAMSRIGSLLADDTAVFSTEHTTAAKASDDGTFLNYPEDDK